MKTRSVLRQTILTILLAELVCAAAFTSTALLHEWRIRRRALDVTLQGRSDSVLGAIQDAEDPETNVTIDPHELNIPQRDIYAVYNQGSRLLGSSKNAPSELIQRRGDGFSTRVLHGQSYRVLEREGLRVIDRAEHGVDGLQRPVTILYAMRSDRVWHEVLEAASFYVGLSVLLIFGTAMLMVVLLRRALRPLEELAIAASTVSIRTLEFVPPDSALQFRELQPLAITLSTTVRGLREAFESQRRFLGDAAHELKTAVAVVRSSIQLMMLRPRTTSEYAQGLATVLNDNMRVEDLVSRMLSLARMEERDNRVLSPIDFATVVQKAVLHLKSFADTHHVNLKEHIEAPMPVRMAAEDVHVLVANLVVNAVQHSSPGAIVELRMERQEKSAILRVRDYGTGISMEALPHVFERFYREDRSRSRETGGAGLGLSICKLIVEGAGGAIAIESKLGDGTNVTVTLPCV
jgi:signal transduction histidine kinase